MSEKNLWAVEWSEEHRNTHISHFDEVIEYNNLLFAKGFENSCSLVGVFETQDEAVTFAAKLYAVKDRKRAAKAAKDKNHAAKV